MTSYTIDFVTSCEIHDKHDYIIYTWLCSPSRCINFRVMSQHGQTTNWTNKMYFSLWRWLKIKFSLSWKSLNYQQVACFEIYNKMDIYIDNEIWTCQNNYKSLVKAMCLHPLLQTKSLIIWSQLQLVTNNVMS
jgi:hypothetical protein